MNLTDSQIRSIVSRLENDAAWIKQNDHEDTDVSEIEAAISILNGLLKAKYTSYLYKPYEWQEGYQQCVEDIVEEADVLLEDDN